MNKINKDVVDVCTILEKCSIDEISKYLLIEGKKKSFPNIILKLLIPQVYLKISKSSKMKQETY